MSAAPPISDAPRPLGVPAPASDAAPNGPEPAESQTELERQRPSLILLTVVSVVSAVLDLASKWWAETNLTGFDASLGGPKHFVVLEGMMDFVYAQNPGGAWSMLRGLPEIIRRPFFLFVSSVAVVFIIAIYVRIDARQRALKWGLPLALGGAVGNLVDRMRYGYVVDFIHIFYEKEGFDFHWPTFNVADIAIVVGVALMAIDLLFGKDPMAPPRDGEAEAESATEPEVARDAPGAHGSAPRLAEPGSEGFADSAGLS